MIEAAANVWGVFVGFSGDQIAYFNSKEKEFPPELGTEGLIAIGWPAVGNLEIYKSDFNLYDEAYRVAYPFPETENQTAQAYGMRKNEPWRFLKEVKIGDAIIAPCSGLGIVMVGIVTGEYVSNFHNEFKLPKDRWIDLVHLRPVRWLHIIERGDERYSAINRIGLMTFSKVQLSGKELSEILEKGV